MSNVITIDGPSGSGKGTMAQLIANALNYHCLDSGAIYRLHAYEALKQSIPLDDEAQLAILANKLEYRVLGNDMGNDIRSEMIGKAASQASAFPSVRLALLERQRQFAQSPGLVTDGRDMGSVVFPHAQVKFYMDASVEERAKRRYQQLQARGIDGTFSHLLEEMAARDHQDKTRSISPLVVPKGAVIIHTDGFTIDEVFDQMMTVIVERLGKINL